MNVIAVVAVDSGRGGLDALTPLAGVPLLERAVRGVLAAGARAPVLVVGVTDGQRDAVHRACAGLPVAVHAHAGQRADTTTSDGWLTLGSADLVLVHDAVRPLTPPTLFSAVLHALGDGHDVVVPVLPLTDTVRHVDDRGFVHGSPDRSELRVVQTPHAYRAGQLAPADLLGRPLRTAGERAAAGRTVHTVAGDPLAFAVRSRWDLELAELLLEGNPT